jgi:peptidoglycan/xylan/chitin deacetylase (PgdA/CDA1 family)
VKLLYASGHALGIHGWLHTNAWNSPNVDPSREIRLVEDALKGILGVSELPDKLLRAPYGAFPKVPISGYSGWYYYGWNIDAKDDYGVDAQTIVNNVVNQLTQKGWPDNPVILRSKVKSAP